MGYNFLYPKESLEYTIINYKKFVGIDVSEEFLKCAEEQLKEDFELKTGIKINKDIGFSTPGAEYNYQKGVVSQCSRLLYVNHNWDPVTIKWESKSGRIYEHHDTDIDCNDVTFWIEGLDVDLIYKQLYPSQILPFKLKDLGYELQVTRINIDCTLEINLRGDCPKSKADELAQQTDNFIAGWNDKSEKQGRKNGIIHNWNYQIENDKIIYEIDLGSTGPLFFKKLLPFFSGFGIIEKIEIC